MERRQWLMKIARGEWHWPELDGGDADDSSELQGPRLVRSTGAKRAVEKLLVRDPSRRARVKDLWNDDWVSGGGIPALPAIEGLPSGSGYSSYIPRIHDQPAAVPSRFPSGLPTFSASPDSSSDLPSKSWRGSAFENVAIAGTAGTSYEDDEEEFDNDRRENDQGAESHTESPATDEEDELEEEDEEGWLVDKDGINNIARSEVPR
ncbi:hypothetical protein BT96DRAFT_161060 [Gymnopus androsaceus JB14]|uniref:Protein kinase domain-containing protein n=1 Tax=Gymnopus androsaceus JB14 TaxID=1447944 RepID=A0A6A4HBP0_9AGAR|nr:hypothetical protein BT96DRAFT_161060 [Gymnopus androsaceus JB14]